MSTKEILAKQNKDLRTRLSNLKVSKQISEDRLNEEIAVLEKKLIDKDKQVHMLQSYIKDCELENEKLMKVSNENERLRNDLNILIARINKDSSNSSKPPSTDGFKKPHSGSLRKRSGKKPGGQPGHVGHTLELFAEPNEVIEKKVDACECGGKMLYDGDYDAKQIVDISVIVNVIEERAMKGYCSRCGKFHQGAFSEKYINKVQYGDGIKALVLLLSERGFIPINRTSEIINSLSGGLLKISDGTISNIKTDFANSLGESIDTILNSLRKSSVLNADETGCKVSGKLDWVQVFADDMYTIFGHNEKRGSLAVEDIELLKDFFGVVMHDHFLAYYKYILAIHAECNVHILRYLKSITETYKHKWAPDMAKLLTDANNYKKERIANGMTTAEPHKLKEIMEQYDLILENGLSEYEEAIKGKKKITYYNDERLLLKRLGKYKKEHMLFLENFDVPFDNNGGERSIRFYKNKMKVSGCFRSKEGARNFARIATVLSTARKQNINQYEAIKQLLAGFNPIPGRL